MTDVYEQALAEAYAAFYDLPWKSAKMFDVMDATAALIRNGVTQPTEARLQKACATFYDLFAHHARTVEQERAINQLMILIL